VLGVVLGELEIPGLSPHSDHDVADPAPGVEALMQEPQLWLAWFEGEEAEGGAEGGMTVDHGSCPSAVPTQTASAGPHAARVRALLLGGRQ